MIFARVCCVFFVLFRFSEGRAVNISNTWVLPEEGFPVFYRYFRDRISWYEADAVCQFHHSYLVTADSSSQYDAIRAYLKELDITDNVWIGLSRTIERPNFTWTNSLQPLSGEGHWQDSIPQLTNPLCVAMDPAKDFLWKSFTCGGPEVASFICETPIPSWAVGPKGCLLTELPSLTVLYIPEQSSLELTSDCGLDGTKRIACKGNADREEILKQLTCAISDEDFEDKATKSGITSPTVSYAQTEGKTTKTAIWTSNTIDEDYGMPTRHRRETENTLSAFSTESTMKSTPSHTFSATNYDTELTTNEPSNSSTIEPVIFNISSPVELEIIQDIPKVNSPSEIPFTSTSPVPPSTIPESVTPIIDTAETSLTTGSSSSSSVPITTSTSGVVEKDVAMEYPSAISQGQLFSIIENGTMFDIIELNETVEQKEEIEKPDDKQKLKPSTKLAQLDEKNTKISGDPKSKPQSKKDIYKNADPKKKNMQKNEDKNKEKLTIIEDPLEFDVKEKPTKIDQDKEEITTIIPKQKREEDPENKTETRIYEEMDKKENSREETDLKSQVETFPIKQIEEHDIDQREDEEIDKKEGKIEEVTLNKEAEVFPVKQVIIENRKIDDDIDKQEEQVENQRKSEIDLNKEVEIFPVINDKSPYLNRTFRKELPMLADEPSDETKDLDENKLELMDNEDTLQKTLNATKIDPNIDLLNKNLSKNNDSEIIGHIDKEVLKKQMLPKPLQGGEEQKPTTTKDTLTEENLENGDHPKPNRQRQLTRPHGRPFYPNFFSRVLG